MRLVAAEWLKLRRRTGLVLSAFGITVVPALIMLGVEDDGGLRGFASHFGVLVLLTVVASILVGAVVGTADETSGVFRDLVVTGRSRLDLFAARVPAGLALVLLTAAAGFAIVALDGSVSAGSVRTGPEALGRIAPTAGLLAKCAAWLALVAVVSFALSLGVASVVGSVRGVDRGPARPLARRNAARGEPRDARLARGQAHGRRPRPLHAAGADGRRADGVALATERGRGAARVVGPAAAGGRVADVDPRCVISIRA